METGRPSGSLFDCVNEIDNILLCRRDETRRRAALKSSFCVASASRGAINLAGICGTYIFQTRCTAFLQRHLTRCLCAECCWDRSGVLGSFTHACSDRCCFSAFTPTRLKRYWAWHSSLAAAGTKRLIWTGPVLTASTCRGVCLWFFIPLSCRTNLLCT